MKKVLLASLALAGIVAVGCGGPKEEAGPTPEETAAARAKFDTGDAGSQAVGGAAAGQSEAPQADSPN